MERVFVPTTVAQRFDPPGYRLADRTIGRNLSIVFSMVEKRVAAGRRVVVVVGDSTIMSLAEPDSTSLTVHTSNAMTAFDPSLRDVEVVEFGALGLPAVEAAVVIAKALSLGAELVVYAITPRVICNVLGTVSDSATYALEWEVARQLGARFLLENYPPRQLAASLVRSHWALLRFRKELNREVMLRLPMDPSSLLRPPLAYAYTAPSFNRIIPPGAFWKHPNCPLSDDSKGMQAFSRIAQMCSESGRCLVYNGPINPRGFHLFEAGLYGDFARLTRRILNEHEVPFLNYVTAVNQNGFRQPPGGHIDAIHLNRNGRARLGSLLGPAVARRLTQEPVF